MILDSGERTVHENGFQRDMHEGKGRMDLLPWRAIIELSKHCEEGAKKYGERNIDKGCPQHSLIDSAFRHLAKYMIGERDEDHLRACLWNVAWALEQDVSRPDMMDIPSRLVKEAEIQEVEEKIDSPIIAIPVGEVKDPFAKLNEALGRIYEKFPKITEEDEAVEGTETHYPEVEGPKSRRCVEMTCFNNTYGTCQSNDETWDPTLGQDCPEFSED